jgi:carboxyl-terminal processing protease
MYRMKKILIVSLFFFAISGFGFGQTPGDQTFEILKNLDIYSSMVKELNAEYVDEIQPGDLTKTGIDAMLESLDPYTNFIPESEVEDYKFLTTGQYGGIGALIHQQGEYVVISEPYEGSPAQKSDLRAGDKIFEINGQSAKGKSYDEVSSILKGQAGTTVDLKILRDGGTTPIEKVITRENIKVDNIPYFGIVGDNIGYIRLTGFTQNASKEVRQAMLKMKETTPIKGYIIDLRGNGGGLLNEAVDISNLFVEKGQEIVTTKGKVADKNRSYLTTNPPVDVNIPLVILVDGQSASASEILAGSMQDLDRGVIIGQRTFGKGLVQNVVPLTYNAQMKITVAKYYIPSGRCIQAIDYSHRAKDGTVSKIPDSLIREFKTKDGRKVFDGGGISPDIQTARRTYSNIAQTLYTKFLIFDYATKFQQQHPTIPPAKDFVITDSIFNDFLAYISDKNYEYITKSEQSLEALKKQAEKENYYAAIKDELNHLETQMMADKKEDIKKYDDQIRELLKIEIVTRYYYQKGKIEASLANDKDIAIAIQTIRDADKFNAILAGKYVQPESERTPAIDNTDEDDQ